MQQSQWFIALNLFISPFLINHSGYTYAESLNKAITPSSIFVKSPNGQWVATVRKSHYIIPNECSYFSEQGNYANEIWLIDRQKQTQKILVSPKFECHDAKKMIIDPHNLQFSPDNKTLYFETSAWATSGAVHAVNVDGTHLRFVTDGDDLRIVRSGAYRGDLIVNQHRYRFKGDTPLGSDNWDWLVTPAGKQIKVYRKEG